MRISIQWLKEYLPISQSPEQLAETLTALGLEEEGLTSTAPAAEHLAGLVVGQVVTCSKHPNADKLSLTTVDVGEAEALNIVCGASNVRAGLKVVVALVGTTLHPVEGEAFTIKKAKVRGEESWGMLCAEDEIGIGKSHTGIIELPAELPVGLPLADYYSQQADTLIDLGLTPNRADAYSYRGIAEDLAAYYAIHHPTEAIAAKLPLIAEALEPTVPLLPLTLKREATTDCPRYAGVIITGVSVGESPAWLKQRLASAGLRSVNNLVDIGNFVMLELGQPLHFFDYDRIGQAEIRIKQLPTGSNFQGLDGTTKTLHEEDLIIADGNDQPMCLAGVFGSADSGVSSETTTVFIESAHFASRTVRRMSVRHGLRTDAAVRFEKGADPNMVTYALRRAAQLTLEIAGGNIASEEYDDFSEALSPKVVEVRYAQVRRLIGADLSEAEIQAILKALGMRFEHSANADGLLVAVPTNKPDVTREADVIEEILRIYGFNNIPLHSELRYVPSAAGSRTAYQIKEEIANFLAANGFLETMCLSLQRSAYFTGATPRTDLVLVNNTSNAVLDTMRPTLLYGSLETVAHNLNRKEERLRLFEFGKTYSRTPEQDIAEITEQACLSLTLVGPTSSESWHQAKTQPTDFFHLKGWVSLLLQRLGISEAAENFYESPDLAWGIALHHNGLSLGYLGKVSRGALGKVGIKADANEVFYAELNWDALLREANKPAGSFKELGRFPSVRRDLALVINKDVSFDALVAVARKAGGKMLREVRLFDVYDNEEQLGGGKISYALAFVLEDEQATLKEAEIDRIMQQLTQSFEQELAAVVRR